LKVQRGRLMLDISYAGSALVGQAGPAGAGPAAGTRFPPDPGLRGTGHHLVAYGDVPRLDRFRGRWDGFLTIVDAAGAGLDTSEAGMSEGGVILVRPDGFIGFRAAPANETAMDLLDAHLATYLVLGAVIGPASRKAGPTDTGQ